MTCKGKLYLADVTREHEFSGHKFSISRKPVSDNYPTLYGLLPSAELLQYALESKKNNVSDWYNEYYFRYLTEVVPTDQFSADITRIKSLLDLGEDVVLLCWCICKDRCHRKIVGSIVQGSGYTVVYN